MRQKWFFVILLLVTHLCGAAQEKDIIKLLDAHDILYFNRLADSFYVINGPFEKRYRPGDDADVKQRMYTAAERAAILNQAEDVVVKIKNLPALRKTYPYTFAQFALELYGLRTIVALEAPDVVYDPLLLQYLDSLDHYYKTPKTETETALLRKETGIRWESLLETGDKNNLHSLATDHKYGFLHTILKLKFSPAQADGAPGQTNDVTRLLDAHDLLFLTRTSGGYASADQRQKAYKVSQMFLSGIKDMRPIIADFPFLHHAHHTERLYLQSLLLADSATKSESEKLQGLDTAIAFFLKSSPYPTTAELNRLGKLVGVRRETVIWPAFPDVNRLILAYNTIVSQWLLKEYNAYQQTKTVKPVLINNLVNRQKPYEISSDYGKSPDSEMQQAVDKTFLAAQAVAFYFSSLQAAQENQCDKLLLYTASFQLAQSLTSLRDSTAYSLMDTAIKKATNSLALSCASPSLANLVKTDLEQQVWEWQKRTDLRPPDLLQSGGSGLNAARFPFPPPEPSRRTTPLVLKGNPKTWQEADRLLTQALSKADYSQVSYYGINGGFAVVTPLEQLKENGAPKSDPPRYEVKVNLRREFSFSAYLKALFFGEKGFYRVLVFMFTNQPIVPTATTSGSIVFDLPPGLDRLPAEDLGRPYTSSHRCTVLVYEFEKAKGDPAKFIKPGRFDVKTHLSRTLIWNDLFY